MLYKRLNYKPSLNCNTNSVACVHFSADHDLTGQIVWPAALVSSVMNLLTGFIHFIFLSGFVSCSVCPYAGLLESFG